MSAGLHWAGPITDEGRDVVALLRAAIAGDTGGLDRILDHADLRATTRVLVVTLSEAMISQSGPAVLDAQLAGLQAQALAELAGEAT